MGEGVSAQRGVGPRPQEFRGKPAGGRERHAHRTRADAHPPHAETLKFRNWWKTGACQHVQRPVYLPDHAAMVAGSSRRGRRGSPLPPPGRRFAPHCLRETGVGPARGVEIDVRPGIHHQRDARRLRRVPGGAHRAAACSTSRRGRAGSPVPSSRLNPTAPAAIRPWTVSTTASADSRVSGFDIRNYGQPDAPGLPRNRGKHLIPADALPTG